MGYYRSVVDEYARSHPDLNTKLTLEAIGYAASRTQRPVDVDYEDILGVCFLSLVESPPRVSEDFPIKSRRAFLRKTFKFRIIDYLRGHGHLSRSEGSMLNKVRNATSQLEQELQRLPYDDEIASEIHADRRVVRNALLQTQRMKPVSLDDCDDSGSSRYEHIPDTRKSQDISREDFVR